METKRFTKNDNSFTCAHCGFEVKALGYSSRNHCPRCLWSLHVDENPGDRECDCHGQMEPIGCIPDPKKGYIIIHKCTKCGIIKRNRSAHEAKTQPDDLKKLIELSAKGY
ncbi:MAG: RNHCP domain-containing protein [Clostridia bacterium]|nr:RNHCP domain-containing protein [Clostridia bacterium]